VSVHGTLGKGLNALLPSTLPGEDALDLGPGSAPPPPSPVDPRNPLNDGSRYMLCPVNRIEANQLQPRKKIDQDSLDELAASIKENGIIQPLVVCETNNGYKLIAGERRWRAAQAIGLTEVPIIVRNASEYKQLEIGLIENIQRQDLNPIEEAEAYNNLIEVYNLTQEEISKRVGKSRSTVANSLRILQLPDYVKEDIAEGRLTSGHGRALIGLNGEQTKIARDKIIASALSVRQTENLVSFLKRKEKEGPDKKKPVDQLPQSYCQALTRNIESYLGSKSKIIQNGQRGKIEIEYYSPDDLERLMGLIVEN
jgi:ParB family transcriptional regulator, chromosome partitioning protein